MGSSNLQKRLLTLKKQVDGDGRGRVPFFKAFVLSFIGLWIVSAILSGLWPSESAYIGPPKPVSETTSTSSDYDKLMLRLQGKRGRTTVRPGDRQSPYQQRFQQMEVQVAERVQWLSSIPMRSGSSRTYLSFSEAMLDAVLPELNVKNSEEEFLNLDDYYVRASFAFADLLLRIGFVFIGFWPFWILSAVVGYFVIPPFLRPRLGSDILGVLDRGNGPFYSGIFGPLRSNSSISGTDLSCPNLACPAQVKNTVALTHSLVSLLKQYSAFNDTNFALVRTVLAHKDFPSFVEEERSRDDEADDNGDSPDLASAAPKSTIIRPDENTLEKNTLDGLRAILEAHRVLTAQQRRASGNKPAGEADPYRLYLSEVAESSQKLTASGKLLLSSLTPTRAQALAKLPATMVASAYLAIEAGKSLVFKRVDLGFAQISRFPHLQARAVLQSLHEYHREYNGDARLVIRQAIIASRRHGDFGRAFLPTNMPLGSRGLRDWLEILSAHSKRRLDVACLTELDAHLEELHLNWRIKLAEKLRPEQQRVGFSSASNTKPYAVWKGLSYRSVVLTPLPTVVDMALQGFSDGRVKRILELINQTRKLQSSLSISARLPGFKRQAVEAEQTDVVSEDMAQVFTTSETGKRLRDNWFVIRRMLTRYNWLSTRVGDYNVPADGLTQGILIDRTEGKKPEVAGLDTLVPLRQRRYKELFGTQWEKSFFDDSPHPDDLIVYVDYKEFTQALKQKMEQAKNGFLDSPPRNLISLATA